MNKITCQVSKDDVYFHDEQSTWFLDYFGQDYWNLVNNSCASLEVTLKELELIEKIIKNYNLNEVLDLCCGNGRHTIPLSKKVNQITALDINEYCIELFRSIAVEQGNIVLMQEDVRNVQFLQKFDLVLLMQTSFGYFSEEENLNLLKKIYEHTHEGGLLLIDLPNKDAMLKKFITKYWVQLDKIIYLFGHQFDYRLSRRNTTMSVTDATGTREYFHSIRMYSVIEMEQILENVGYQIVDIIGDFGDSFDRLRNDHSRIQYIVQKK